MKTQTNTKEAVRLLRWQLAMPGPMVLLVTVLFWSLGGGAGSKPDAAADQAGLNTQVPAAAKDGRPVDKLAMYQKDRMDSMRRVQRDRGAARLLGEDSVLAADSGRYNRRDGGAYLGDGGRMVDANELRVRRQVAALKGRLDGTPAMQPGVEWRNLERANSGVVRERSMDIDRMERLVATLKEGGSAGSPEMQELNRTLDKIIAVKTGRAAGLRGAAADTRVDTGLRGVLPVAALGKEEAVSSMKGGEVVHNRFYDLESGSREEEPAGTAIEAVVPVTQTLISGATIRMELATELVIRGQRIRRGASLYGVVRLNNDRLQVSVSSIRCGTEVYPVALRVLDQDGLAGIYAPGSMTRDAARESASEAVGGFGGAGLETTASGQAVNAGIQLARNLARRKVQLARVTVKAGYRVFLQDESKGR